MLKRDLRRAVGVLVLLLLCGQVDAQTVNKIALVIGNTNYGGVDQLTNPSFDADLMSNAFVNLGFTLVGGKALKDADLSTFQQALKNFASAANNADVAVFYFSGHGLQLGDQNYLVPIGAHPLNGAVDVPKTMIGASDILSILDKSSIRLKIIILDACRNNPFKSYLPVANGLAPMSNGLTAMQAPVGTVIWYATQPGALASDVGSNGGPFATAISHNIIIAGQDIYAVFNHTGLEVLKLTGSRQLPWLAATPLDGDFYFRQAGSSSKSLFVGSNSRVAQLFSNGIQTATKSFSFGQDYDVVNKQMDSYFSIASWNALPPAAEYRGDDVRYLWMPLLSLPAVSSTIIDPMETGAHCIDPGSYIVFLFKQRRLFSVSVRFARGAQCADYDSVFDHLFCPTSTILPSRRQRSWPV